MSESRPAGAAADTASAAPQAANAPRRRVRSGGASFVLLALAALLVGAAVWTPLPPGVWHDDGVYLLLGGALAAGEGLHYVGVPGNPPAPKFPPVYPAVMAVAWLLGGDAGGAARAAAGLNILFLASAVGLAAAWARRGLGLPLAPALIVGGLAGLSVDLWRPAMVALSEPLYILVMIGALWAAARAERPEASWREAALLVALLTLLVHVRTAGVAVAGAAVLGLTLRGRWRAAAGVAGSLAVLALPWTLWSAAAGAALPAPLRDILGPYGAWLGNAVMDAPLRYAAGLPAAAAGVTSGALELLVPAPPRFLGWVAAPLLAAGVVGGLPLLGRRSPTAALALVLSLVTAWLWPYQDRRLLLPVLPLLMASLACAADALARVWRARDAPPEGHRGRQVRPLAAAALGVLLLWAASFGAVSAVRLARGWPTAGYEIRARKLEGALEAMRGRVPPGAVVGAPELWPAIPLLAGLRAAPSARLLPFTAGDTPRYGTPEQQLASWAASGVDHLLLEQGGAIHDAALDALEAACPGAVGVLHARPGLILVRLGWDEACRRRVGVAPAPRR